MLSREEVQMKLARKKKLKKIRKRIRHELRQDMAKYRFKNINRKMRSSKYVAVVVLAVRRRMA